MDEITPGQIKKAFDEACKTPHKKRDYSNRKYTLDQKVKRGESSKRYRATDKGRAKRN